MHLSAIVPTHGVHRTQGTHEQGIVEADQLTLAVPLPHCYLKL